MVIADHVCLHARLTPDRLAMDDLAHAKRWTYGALDRAIAQCASLLLMYPGYGAGARVASLARNRAELAILHLACARTGGIYVPLNWRLAPCEIAALLADAEPCLVFADADMMDRLAAGMPTQDAAALGALIAGAAMLPTGEVDRTLPSLILYTSGTSGRPKGVVLTEANLDQTAINFSILAGVGPGSVFLSDSPMFHVIGLITSVRPVLMNGAALLLSDSFVPARTLDRLADPTRGVTHYFCVPQMAARLRHDPAYDPAPLRGRVTVFTGGAPHARADIMRWVDDGIPIADGFGMSEAGTVFGMPPDCAGIARKAGSAGVPPPAVRARLVAADGTLCPDGEIGELQLRGANITAGYWRRPEETRRAFTRDNWFLTGDLAVRDADGFYTLVDRKKDMFISGGENVYPAEIEAALAGFPGLIESAVVGMPDARWGEVGHCALVAAPGIRIEIGAIEAHLKDRVARYKLPRAYTPLDALPRTASGKVKKAELRHVLMKVGGTEPVPPNPPSSMRARPHE